MTSVHLETLRLLAWQANHHVVRRPRPSCPVLCGPHGYPPDFAVGDGWLPGKGLGADFTSQITLAYSLMVRSVENLPMLDAAWMLRRAHVLLSAYVASTLACAST
eukprot:CAMPEP_0117558586 /NCGR_PEP_ID=MMETSP0784-20121206/52918_1 /TAXON_ID=39447 /ORGANISM="" /LENGTH=104 /DNA_ID=CAMNT_0005355931 /DNA_START=393 /DNA_END=707 /DNA_ORIENTATION=+